MPGTSTTAAIRLGTFIMITSNSTVVTNSVATREPRVAHRNLLDLPPIPLLKHLKQCPLECLPVALEFCPWHLLVLLNLCHIVSAVQRVQTLRQRGVSLGVELFSIGLGICGSTLLCIHCAAEIGLGHDKLGFTLQRCKNGSAVLARAPLMSSGRDCELQRCHAG